MLRGMLMAWMLTWLLVCLVYIPTFAERINLQMVIELQGGLHVAIMTLQWAAMLLFMIMLQAFLCSHLLMWTCPWAKNSQMFFPESSCHPQPLTWRTVPYSSLWQPLRLANVWCIELIEDWGSKEFNSSPHNQAGPWEAFPEWPPIHVLHLPFLSIEKFLSKNQLNQRSEQKQRKQSSKTE